MTAENITILEKHYHHWVTLRDAQFLRGLNQHEVNDILQVAREEFFGADYNPDTWCGQCMMDFIRNTYTQFDKTKQL